MCKAVIFDFNGTLFLDGDKHVKAWSAIAEELRGTSVTPEELHNQMNGLCNQEIVTYLKAGLSKEENKKYSQLKESYYREFCKQDSEHFHLTKGAETLFDRLKEKEIPFTIASASIWENIQFFIESFHLNRWVDTDKIVYDDGSYVGKVMMFKDAAKKLGVSIEDVVIFEDSVSGITNAYEAGCRNIVVINSSGDGEKLKKLPGVQRVIEDFTDL